MTFGRQRPPADIAALVLLTVGFTSLAAVLLFFFGTWSGVVLPVAFLIGAIAGLRSEVREVEVRPDALIVKTFFRAYRMPRAHITRVLRTAAGVSVEVLSGRRYEIAPRGVDAAELLAALQSFQPPVEPPPP